MLFQTRKTFVRLRNTNEDICDAFWELSDLHIDSKVIKTINVQKHSKEIGQIIHVTSGVQPNFTKLQEYFYMQIKQK